MGTKSFILNLLTLRFHQFISWGQLHIWVWSSEDCFSWRRDHERGWESRRPGKRECIESLEHPSLCQLSKSYHARFFTPWWYDPISWITHLDFCCISQYTRFCRSFFNCVSLSIFHAASFPLILSCFALYAPCFLKKCFSHIFLKCIICLSERQSKLWSSKSLTSF